MNSNESNMRHSSRRKFCVMAGNVTVAAMPVCRESWSKYLG